MTNLFTFQKSSAVLKCSVSQIDKFSLLENILFNKNMHKNRVRFGL